MAGITMRAPLPARATTVNIIDLAWIVQFLGAMMLVTGMVMTIVSGSSESGAAVEDRDAGSAALQAANLLVYLPSILFVLARPAAFGRLLVRAWPLTLLIAATFISCLWSVDPTVSLRRAFALAVAMLWIAAAASYFPPRRFIVMMGWVFAVMVSLSLVAALIPHVGITPHGVHTGRWRGILGDKNVFGELTGTACFTFLMLRSLERRGSLLRWMWSGLFALSLVELYLASARTSLIALIAAMGAMEAARFVQLPTGWQRRIVPSLRISLVTSALISVFFIIPVVGSVVLTLLGRDLTRSGRTKLWSYAIDKGLQRPWFGAGYKAFWTDKITFDLRILHADWNVEGETFKLTANAHNGYLDSWLDLGFLGLTLVLTTMVTILVRASRRVTKTRDEIYIWYFGAVGFAALFYCTNSMILQHSVLTWFLVAYSMFALSAPLAGPGTIPTKRNPA